MHAYLGLHVLARGVIFVDLALAQMAALGLAAAALAGHPIQSDAAYWYALVFALGGALFLSAPCLKAGPVPAEAVIGIIYAVSAAGAVLLLDLAPQGGEQIRQLLVGSILTVTPREVSALTGLYAAIGALHVAARVPLLEISRDPGEAARRGRRVARWDAFFYGSFALVVTSSVRVAGVLLVFAFLVVPAAIAALLARSVASRLVVGWTAGIIISALGLAASYAADLPTGAAVVAAFGAAIAGVAVILGGAPFEARPAATGERGSSPHPSGRLRAHRRGRAPAHPLFRDGPSLARRDGGRGAAPADRLSHAGRARRPARHPAGSRPRSSGTGLARGAPGGRAVGRRPRSGRTGTRAASAVCGRAPELTAGDQLFLRVLRARARERQQLWLGA